LYREQRYNKCPAGNMKALPAAILSKDLKASDIPSGFKEWSQMIEFAATLYPRLENVDYFVSPGIDGIVPSSTVLEIRTALLKEYRRYNHFGHYPEQEVFEGAVRAIDLLRSKVQ
jgi:hypothetical protein